MSRSRAALVAALLLLCAAAPPPDRLAALRRGVNITGWFRFADGQSAAALAGYMSDAAITQLAHAGFTFVRLPFDPAFALRPERRAILIAQTERLERAGLAVVLVPASADWRLDDHAADREALRATWRDLAPALRQLDPARTFPEIVNEPVFSGHPEEWPILQAAVATIIRRALPDATIIASGADWSSAAGLEATEPLPDRNIVYTFHFYDPSELTSLAAYRPGLDRAALAAIPFPISDPEACGHIAATTDAGTAGLIRFVCAGGWTGAAIEARIKRVAAWAKQHDVPVLAGEFGASVRLNRTARLSWIAAVRTACEGAGIGWALWGYDDVMGFDVARPPPQRPRLDPGLLAALGIAAIPEWRKE